MVRNVTANYYQTAERPKRADKELNMSRNGKKRQLSSQSPPVFRQKSNNPSSEINLTIPPSIIDPEENI